MQFKSKIKIFKFSKYCKIEIQLNVTVYTKNISFKLCLITVFAYCRKSVYTEGNM